MELPQRHEQLLNLLQISGTELRSMVERRATFYDAFSVKARAGRRARTVYRVNDGLRRVHRVVSVVLRPWAGRLPENVTGFRKGGGTRKHAELHCGAALLATADVRCFFESIDERRVWALFKSLGATPNVAMTLAKLTTLNDKLPEGSRCSPAIANLVGQQIDRVIESHLPQGCRYSRYADDLAFSGTRVPTEEEVAAWLQQAGFALKVGSYLRRARKHGPYVTGLFVGGSEPRVPRWRRRMIERTLHYLSRGPDRELALRKMRSDQRWEKLSPDKQYQRLLGQIAGVSACDKALGEKYFGALKAALGLPRDCSKSQVYRLDILSIGSSLESD